MEIFTLKQGNSDTNWGLVPISLLKMQREGKKNRRKKNHRLLAYQAEEALKRAIVEAIAEHKR